MALEARSGQLKEFWSCREIVKRLARVDVAEVGREQWEAGLWVTVMPVGLKKGVYREAVTNVMEPGPA